MTETAERLATALTNHTRTVIVVGLLATVLIGAGAPFVDDETDLGQFEGDSEASQANAFIEENFIADGAENETTIQVIRRGETGEDVFTPEEFVRTLEFQQEILDHPDIGPTLIEPGVAPEGADPILAAESEQAIIGIGNILALHELERLTADLDDEQMAAVDMEAVAGVDTIGELRLADLGITSTGDLPMEDFDNATATDFLDSIVEEHDEIDDVGDFLTLLNEREGDIPLAALGIEEMDDVPPTLLGFEGVETAPTIDCLVAMSGADGGLTPPLSCQIWALEEMSDAAFEDAAATVLGEDGELDALALLPQSYEAGTTTASAHAMMVTQETEGGSVEDIDGFSENVTEAQLALQQLGDQQDEEYIVFGLAIVTSEIDRSLEDSTAIVGPIALLFVVLVLTIAYRDLLDIVLGIAGILAVLLWTFGFMGWTGISFNQLMIAVPVLLIGLSIDYAIHVFMRHRERRETVTDVRRSMAVALGGVGVALVWVTATAAFGFLSNLISPIRPLQEFGVASAFGIISALVIFGALIPALKIELDTALEARGYDRQRRAFGTGGSALSSVLEAGSVAARRAPLAVLILAVVLSAGGVYGAVQVDTSFEEEDFLAEDPPAWTQALPGPMQPGEYRVTDDLAYVGDNFQQVGREGELLVTGDVTNERVLEWMDAVSHSAEEYESVFILPNDRPDVRSPLSEMRETAEVNESFADSYAAASGGNGVPTENVTALYDELLTLYPLASETVYRNNGEYEAVRLQIGISGDVGSEQAAEDVRALAADLEEESDGALSVVPTGEPVVNDEVERDLLQTVIESLLITLVSVFIFLAVAYRLTGNPASLGVVTLLPVLFAVTWILGTMYLIGMPFNAITGTIAALTIGLGIAYSIHISARYELELDRQGNVWDAMDTTVTGTGGALLGSAATTVLGFGTLALAILPALRQFGIITAVTIVYAFLASVLVLPSLLVLWTRYLGPAGAFSETDSDDTAGSVGDSHPAPGDASPSVPDGDVATDPQTATTESGATRDD